MILSTKNINVTNTDLGLNINLTTKDGHQLKLNTNSKFTSVNSTKDLKLSLQYKSINTVNTSIDINIKTLIHKPKEKFIEEVIVDDTIVELFNWEYEIPVGWSLFSCPIDITKSVMTHNYMTGYQVGDEFDYTTNTNYNLNTNILDSNTPYIDSQLSYFDLFFKNNIYEYLEDEIPLFYKDEEKYKEDVSLVKDSSGKSYIPEFNFDGIKSVNQFMGYSVSTMKQVYFKIKAPKHKPITTIDNIDFTYSNGWQFISFNSLSFINIEDYLKPFTDNGNVELVKNTNAKVFWPEYGFNGIGDMQPGQAYSAKFINL
tara:strand:+ start:31884 stop:32825 length:942 start_codon:yes stop_codon:yes gene_type:complete